MSPGCQEWLFFSAVSLEATLPATSLGNSTPVFTPSPKYLAYFANTSISILVPIV